MIGSDKQTYEKMVSVFQITQIPALKMSTSNGQASFTWGKGFITGFPMAQFYKLEPIEIAMLIEAALEELSKQFCRVQKRPIQFSKLTHSRSAIWKQTYR